MSGGEGGGNLQGVLATHAPKPPWQTRTNHVPRLQSSASFNAAELRKAAEDEPGPYWSSSTKTCEQAGAGNNGASTANTATEKHPTSAKQTRQGENLI